MATATHSLAQPPHHRHSHYRPFSTLFTESPYVELSNDKPSRLLKRSSSLGGFQPVPAMSSTRERSKSKSDHSNIPRVSEAPKQVSAPLRLFPKSNAHPKPSHSTPAHTVHPLSHPVKKKRSMASLFSSNDSPPHTPSAPSTPLISHPRPEPSQRTSPPSTSKVTRFANDSKVLEYDPDVPQKFIPKSVWPRRHKTKLHPYQNEAVYMQSYDRVLLDNDRYSHLLLQRLSNGMPTFFECAKSPPATALDLGCGQGHWVLHAANVWKNSLITGLDLVNILTPAFESAENAFFVQGNFTQFRLPFPDKSFEYVRMANLVLCIPFDKWEFVLSEAQRVLTIGGTLEVIDDQIFFPYAKPPTAATPKTPHNACHVPSARFSSPLDDFFDDEDSDTLHGEETSSSESTLHSEPCSFEDKHSHLVESETVRPIASVTQSTIRASPTPTSGSPTRETRQEVWERQATAARDLESIFEAVLSKQHGVFPRPSEFILKLLGRVFGRENSGKTKSFHIKLAPVDSPIGVVMAAEEHEDDFAKAVALSQRGKKAWMPAEWDKRRKDKRDKKSSPKMLDPMGEASERSSLEDASSTILSTPLPASINAKAAERLGLPKTSVSPIKSKALPPLPPKLNTQLSKGPNRSSPSSRSPSPSPTSSSSPSSSSPPSAPTPQPRSIKPPVLSAKAAGRLGISYSELTSIAASSPNHPLSNSIPVQSPGLLVWPHSYIPMSPNELEMHACKHIHSLIGCKAALSEFASRFLDEQGRRYVEDDELEEAIWEYECFRRSRFNWPLDAPDLYEDDPHRPGVFSPSHPSPREILSPATAATTNNKSESRFDFNPASSHSRKSSFDESFNGQHRSQDLVHVRTIRVFQAYKTQDNLPMKVTSGLFGSRTPTKMH